MRLPKKIKNFISQGIKVYAIIYILIGLLILALEGIDRTLFIKGNLIHWDNINIGWKSLLESIGIVFFTLGLGTITLELGEFTEFFVRRLTDVIVKDEYLDRISPAKMEEIMKKIETKLYFNGGVIDKDNFYHIVQNSLSNLLHSFYYKEFFILIECDIDENKKLIKKSIHKRIKIVNGIDKDKNGKSKNKISIPFGGEFKSIKGKEIGDIYKIISVVLKEEKFVDDHIEYLTEDYTKRVNDEFQRILKERIRYKENEEGFYQYVLDFNYTFDACETCTIEIDVETLVPTIDFYLNYRLSAPCQNYTVVYNLLNKDYTLDGFAFSFLKDNYGDAALIRKFDNSMVIEFSDWVMPGEGFVIYMNKK